MLIGLPSSGVHSNGYSLVRKLVQREGLKWAAPAPFAPTTTLAESLLAPTRIYVKPVLAAIRKTGAIKALAHITGGGLTENLPRVLPDGIGAAIDLASFTPPPVFGWLARAGRLDDAEMLRTFNCGIGLVLVVDHAKADAVIAALQAEGEAPVVVGAHRNRPRRQVRRQGQRRSRSGALRRAAAAQRVSSASCPRR